MKWTSVQRGSYLTEFANERKPPFRKLQKEDLSLSDEALAIREVLCVKKYDSGAWMSAFLQATLIKTLAAHSIVNTCEVMNTPVLEQNPPRLT